MDEINTICFDYNKSEQTNRILSGYYDPSEQQFFPIVDSELEKVIIEFAKEQDSYLEHFDYFDDGRPNESTAFKFLYQYDGKVTLVRYNDKEQFSSRTAEEFTMGLEKFKPFQKSNADTIDEDEVPEDQWDGVDM